MPKLPGFAQKIKKLASEHIFCLKSHLITGRRLSKFKKQYRLKGELGSGGFGLVYKATRLADDLPIAVKFIERRHVREWGKLNDKKAPMEICTLAKCADIPGVITLIDWFTLPEGFLIIMERPVPSIDLFDFVHANGKLDEDLARHFFRQIVQTTISCMNRGVLHRDLKDENVVIDLLTGETRLVDFGAATMFRKARYQDFQGTRLYCPPEWFLHSLYLVKEATVWSLGVLLYNMLNGQLPFLNEKDICTAHLLGPLQFFASDLSLDARNLLTQCLAFDPYSRPELESILSHSFLSNYDDGISLTPCWAEISQKARFSFEAEPVEDTHKVLKNIAAPEDQLKVVTDSEEINAMARHLRHLILLGSNIQYQEPVTSRSSEQFGFFESDHEEKYMPLNLSKPLAKLSKSSCAESGIDIANDDGNDYSENECDILGARMNYSKDEIFDSDLFENPGNSLFERSIFTEDEETSIRSQQTNFKRQRAIAPNRKKDLHGWHFVITDNKCRSQHWEALLDTQAWKNEFCIAPERYSRKQSFC